MENKPEYNPTLCALRPSRGNSENLTWILNEKNVNDILRLVEPGGQILVKKLSKPTENGYVAFLEYISKEKSESFRGSRDTNK